VRNAEFGMRNAWIVERRFWIWDFGFETAVISYPERGAAC